MTDLIQVPQRRGMFGPLSDEFSEAVGSVLLVAGSGTVPIPGALQSDLVYVSYMSTNNAGIIEGRISAPGTLLITSSNGADTSQVAYRVVRAVDIAP